MHVIGSGVGSGPLRGSLTISAVACESFAQNSPGSLATPCAMTPISPTPTMHVMATGTPTRSLWLVAHPHNTSPSNGTACFNRMPKRGREQQARRSIPTSLGHLGDCLPPSGAARPQRSKPFIPARKATGRERTRYMQRRRRYDREASPRRPASGAGALKKAAVGTRQHELDASAIVELLLGTRRGSTSTSRIEDLSRARAARVHAIWIVD